MKRYFLSIAVAAAVGACLSGCSNKAGSALGGNFAIDSIAYSYVAADSSVTSVVSVDFPTDTDSLALVVRTFINNRLADASLPVAYTSDGEGQSPVFAGNSADGQTMADFYGTVNAVELNKQLKELLEYDCNKGIRLSHEIKMKKESETAKCVTYCTTTYCYLGGAHGSATSVYTMFSKDDCREITNTVDTSKLAELQPLLKKGVVDYFKQSGEQGVTADSLDNYITLVNGNVPLPVGAPYLAADGVHFIYQQYEIGAYAIGMVNFVVPYADIKPFLTSEALKLME